eukprot:10550821-Lingulodinium_polyedra.AAC.1
MFVAMAHTSSLSDVAVWNAKTSATVAITLIITSMTLRAPVRNGSLPPRRNACKKKQHDDMRIRSRTA